jgi:Putative MetA-pathway of phenol degradation
LGNIQEHAACVLMNLLMCVNTPVYADSCPKPSDPIETDRPDITNSSRVVPAGSLQFENGVNITTPDHSLSVDGTYTRARLGIAPCLEVLLDIPTYFATLSGPAPSGFTNLAPAVKWQISPVPAKIDLSAVAGVGLPTGTERLVGPGPQPYLQFPWSVELSELWSINGMFTTFFHPSDPLSKEVYQSTFVLERKLGNKTALFVEWIGEFPSGAPASHALNSGAIYRLSNVEQIDFHLGAGLNAQAPGFVFGLGYSYRFDRPFWRP